MMKTPHTLLSSMSQLRALLFGVEVEAGLQKLSAPERDVLYAAMSAHLSRDGFVRSDEIRGNALAEHLTDPTFQRALRSLVEKGYLRKAPGYKRGAYILS
ncbi:hypothetical protein CCR83_05735 [Rhodobacter veldkampii DSM 11550]|uniref:MarR family transcriptional regulator n=2 Tax=Phaeovulum veldkampii TaxID=33049 RepID=A0A2T4JM09_9RHOB|nr:hypothetical protein [Phaeovulum veldkampii]MBK5945965.1 hypothetical protein [Phaeovulum veldkampii DSM 11550]PTE18912.1 hypothetical protein C5F46_01745 [Phaeovulum veldkampii DSM 11550]TDQ64640.1 hypothetical protein EV658_101102 [Phaeovulum veldkampii DSM 11550]